MSRQVFDIKEFNYGIISSVDAEDIPPESASDSLNVDGDVGEGILRGIPTDAEYLTNGNTSLVDVRLGELIEHDNVYSLFYHDANANKIIGIKDFHNSTVASRLKEDMIASMPTDNVTMVVHNKEVHIGRGNTSASTPYWIGRIDYGQFGMSTNYTQFEGADPLDNDITASTSGYTGLKLVTFDVEVDNIGVVPNTYKWRKDGGAYTTGVQMTTGATALSDGVTVLWASTAGHALDNKWHITTMGYYVSLANLSSMGSGLDIATVAETAGSGDKYFLTSNTYMWAYSLIVDGYQESPIVVGSITTDAPASDSEYYTVTIRFADGTTTARNFNRRITGINLYRTEYPTTGSVANRGLWRLVNSVDINDAAWATVGVNYDINIIDYGLTSKIGSGTPINWGAVSFNENSGLSESLAITSVNYALSTSGNVYHFVGKCYISTLPDSSRYIFRSKNLRFDMFDWTSDFLVMPEAITAMQFYDGKLWAFSLNKTYRINPDGLYIEDVFDDAGCQGQRAVHSNEYGMFFGNFQSAWMYRGGTFSRISDAIRQSTTSGKSWTSFYQTTLTDLIITSDSKKGYVLFINERNSSGAKLFAWAYHPFKKRWDAFSFADYASSANAGVFKGKDGEVYFSYGTATQKLMRNTGYQLWEWYSQELPNVKVRQKKSFSLIKVDATGTVTITYGVDGATPATAYTNETLINVYNKSIKIKLNAASGSNSVDALELVYRLLIGER